MSGVHQFVPALIPRDATGSHTLLLRAALRDAGFESEIYAEATHDELVGETRPFRSYQSRVGDVLVYQFSSSSAIAQWLLTRSEPLVIDYHNVTRPGLFVGFDPRAAARAALAVEQLAALAPRAALGLADSSFNEADLLRFGCTNTQVVPVLVDLARLGEPDPFVLARLASLKESGGSDWLFVGRIVPSKAQHRLIEALWWYRREYGEEARLHLVGGASSRSYLNALRGLSSELGVDAYVRLWGDVSDRSLSAHYQSADVYVSASLHEGFGIPLLEAMSSGLAVVAAAEAAVPDTIANAGILLEHANASTLATAVAKVLHDAHLRDRLVAAAAARVRQLADPSHAGVYVAAIGSLTSRHGVAS